MKRGDVIINTLHHTVMYIGNGRIVAARIKERKSQRWKNRRSDRHGNHGPGLLFLSVWMGLRSSLYERRCNYRYQFPIGSSCFFLIRKCPQRSYICESFYLCSDSCHRSERYCHSKSRYQSLPDSSEQNQTIRDIISILDQTIADFYPKDSLPGKRVKLTKAHLLLKYSRLCNIGKYTFPSGALLLF